MPIENRNLEPGTRLMARYHKERYVCEVIAGEDGKIRYRLEDGREFKSPSAAGTGITGKSCNGWVFWTVEAAQAETTPAPEETNTEIEEQNPATPAESAPESSPARKRIYRVPNQKGVPEGQTRWYCRDCSQSFMAATFMAATGKTPETCPKGHRA